MIEFEEWWREALMLIPTEPHGRQSHYAAFCAGRADPLREIERLTGALERTISDRDRLERAAVEWMTAYNKAKAEVERLTKVKP